MESLHPRVLVIWLGQGFVLAAVLGGVVGAVDFFFIEAGFALPIAVFLVVATVTAIHAVIRFRIWRYEIRDDELYLERGVITRVKTIVPYVRIQHVDSRRGPIERLLRLATTVVYTAGSRGADVYIPGLTPTHSEALQDDLKRLAIDSEGEDAV